MSHQILFEDLNGLVARYALASSTEGQGKTLFIVCIAGASTKGYYEICNRKGDVLSTPSTLRTAIEEYNKL